MLLSLNGICVVVALEGPLLALMKRSGLADVKVLTESSTTGVDILLTLLFCIAGIKLFSTVIETFKSG